MIGWDDEQTVQIEGTVDEPQGAELDRLKLIYFAARPDGVERQAWKDIFEGFVRALQAGARHRVRGARRSMLDAKRGRSKEMKIGLRTTT